MTVSKYAELATSKAKLALSKAEEAVSKYAPMANPRHVVFLVAGVCFAAFGLLLLLARVGGEPAEQATAVTVAVPSPPPAATAAPAEETTGALPATQSVPQGVPAPPVEQAAPAKPIEGAGKILISKRPIEMLAAPSSSASAMYGFPAGRPFRLIDREAGFARIQDLKSGASGWIEEAALEPAKVPKASAPPKPTSAARKPSHTRAAIPKPKAAAPKPKATAAKPSATKKEGQATAEAETAEPDPAQTRRRGGLFSGRGPIAEILQGAFGAR
jgi:outer membrane biosynthesis protein TonB